MKIFIKYFNLFEIYQLLLILHPKHEINCRKTYLNI